MPPDVRANSETELPERSARGQAVPVAQSAGTFRDGPQTGEYRRAEPDAGSVPVHTATFVADFVREQGHRLLRRDAALCRVLGMEDFAPEAAAQTILRLLARGAPIADRGPRSAERYALVVLRRLCVDERRRRALEGDAGSRLPLGVIEPDDSVERLRADLLRRTGPTADPGRILRASLCCFEYLAVHVDPGQPSAASCLRAYWLACVEGASDEDVARSVALPQLGGAAAPRGQRLLLGWLHALLGAGPRPSGDAPHEVDWQTGFEAGQSFLLEHPDWWSALPTGAAPLAGSNEARPLGGSVAEQTASLLALVMAHERAGQLPADRLVLEVDGQWTAELSGHTEAVRVRLGPRARSVTLRDEQGALRACLLVDELDVAGEASTATRAFDGARVGLVLSRRPGGLELEVLTGVLASTRARVRGTVPRPEDGALGPPGEAGRSADEPPPSKRPDRGDARPFASNGRAAELLTGEAAGLCSPPMLEDELGGQVSVVRAADEDGPRPLGVVAVAARPRGAYEASPPLGRAVRLALAGVLFGSATVGLLLYQQARFERQMAVDLAERRRLELELERARLEREKAETERRIRELQDELRVAKDETERVRLQAELEQEEAKVEVTRSGAASPGSGTAARSTRCRSGEPACEP